jgi:hypothetical protein
MPIIAFLERWSLGVSLFVEFDVFPEVGYARN